MIDIKIRKIFKNILFSGSERSVNTKKNIASSFFIKGISILISLLIIPITIDYVNPTQYGIWLALSSIVLWVSYFDLGFTHGFRNRFTEAKAIKNVKLAKAYVSTTYLVLFILFFVIGIITLCVNFFLDWSKILSVDSTYKSELTKVFIILISFFCMQMVVKTIGTLLTADQKPALASVIDTLGQLLMLVVIYVLTKFTKGSLINLALVLSLIPFIVYLIATFVLFKNKYKEYRPSIKTINLKLISSIIGLGAKFFIIQLSMVLIFQGVNLVLVRIQGPEEVSIYNVAIKYFNVIPMIMNIVLVPLWSAYTDAYMLNDYEWMNKTYKKLDKTWLGLFVFSVILLVISPFVFKLWIGGRLTIPLSTSVLIFIYQVIMTRANVYMILLNGIGKVQIQMYTYVAFALITIPVMIYFCMAWGLNGIIVSITLPFVIQMIFGHIQINKILNKSASGIWNK